MKKIAILGATGSVGTQALDVIDNFRDRFTVTVISANTNADKAVQTANRFKPLYIVMGNEKAATSVKNSLEYNADVFCCFSDVIKAIRDSETDYVLLATSGLQGIRVFEYCLKNNISVGLANKESLVCGGNIVKKLMRETLADVFPVDSEHSAVYQCLNNTYNSSELKSILLTASGGPFFGKSKEFLENVTLADTLNHPNWSMGKKITVDSALLSNKGQEVIEAAYLFDMHPENIKVLVHPQSLVHSMVEYKDGSIIAQIGPIDMRLPLQRALLENRVDEKTLWNHIDLTDLADLQFFKPDNKAFRCLGLAYDALKTGGCSTAVYSIADEIAVEFFLKERIQFCKIPDVIESLLEKYSSERCKTVDDIIELDRKIRKEFRI